MRAVASILSLSALLPVFALSAQVQPTVELGTRVRISALPITTNAGRVVGTLVGLDGENIVVQASDIEPLVIGLRHVTRLEVSRGQKTRWLAGLGVGFVAGGAIGAVVGYVADEEGNDTAPELVAAVVAGAGAVLGGLIGTAIGSTIKTDRWEEVPLDQLQVKLAVQRNGRLRIGVSLSF